MIQPLEADARREALASLPLWREVEGVLERTFVFGDFAGAWGFMSRMAVVAAELDHHPEWSNVYNRVVCRLTTHDCGGLSEKDINLARRMDEAAHQHMEIE